MESERKQRARLRARAWYAANKGRKRNYDRARRAEQPHRYREASKRFYARHKDRLKKPKASRVLRTDEEKKSALREWYLKNKRRLIEKASKWKAANPEKALQIKRSYKKTAKGLITNLRYKRGRRAAHRLATPEWRNQSAIDAIYTVATSNALHVDHIVPLKHPLVCGLHVEFNLRAISPLENFRKGNRWWPDMPIESTLSPDGVRG